MLALPLCPLQYFYYFTDIDECASSPCKNEGTLTCADGVNESPAFANLDLMVRDVKVSAKILTYFNILINKSGHWQSS